MPGAVFWHGLAGWMAGHPGWGVAATFAVGYGETLAFVGYAVPGLALFFALGVLVGGGALPPLPVVAAAAGGAFLGDVTSYALGRHYGERLLAWGPVARRAALVTRGRTFCERHGRKSVFLGRFVGFVRPLVPVVVGVGGLPPGAFLAIDLPAALLWAPLTLFPGYAVGAALGYGAQGAVRLALVLALLGVGAYAVSRLLRARAAALRRLLRRGFESGVGLLRRLVGGLASEVPSVRLGDRGVLLWGLLVLYGAGWFLVTLVRRFEGYRHPGLVELVIPSRAGAGAWAPLLRGLAPVLSPPVWIGVLAVAFLAAGRARERVTLGTLALLAASAAGFDLVLLPGILGLRARTGLETTSLFAPVAVAWTLTGLAGRGAGRTAGRAAAVALVAAGVAAAALAAVLLRTVWLSAALGTAVLGIAWGVVLVHVHRRHGGRPLPAAPLVLAALLFASAAFAWGVVHAPPRPAAATMRLGRWWSDGWNSAAAGSPGRGRVPINVEYAGPLGRLADALARAGWRRPPPLTARRLLYWFAPGVPAARLPLLPVVRGGRPSAALWVRRRRAGGSWTLVVWRSRLRIGRTRARLWLGRIGELRLRRLPLLTLPGGGGGYARGLARLAADLARDPRLRLRRVRTGTGWRVLLVRPLRERPRPPVRRARNAPAPRRNPRST